MDTYRIRHTGTDHYIVWWEGEATSAAEAINKAKGANALFRKEGELYIRVKTYKGYGGWAKVKDLTGINSQ